jgi:predicted alpha/beta-fold hydrolase
MMDASMRAFEPHVWLHNPHAMTLAGALWPRRARRLPSAESRRFEVEAGTFLLAKCHWQARPRECATLVLVHGLEGSSESGYMRGLAGQAFVAGLNVLRVNQRTCGGSEELTPTLYGSGLSDDYRAILGELIEHDRLPALFFAGYSMGGNLVLSMAGRLGADAPAELRGVCGVCPTIELAACVEAIGRPSNALYERHFVGGLKARLRRKARIFPGQFALGGLDRVRTVREFDNGVTAPHFGYRDADDYYYRASARRVMDQIGVPTLIITAQDDPVVPFSIFAGAEVRGNSRISLLAPPQGGHCAFISRLAGWERFWAEARVVEFCLAARGKGGNTESTEKAQRSRRRRIQRR